jgi:hypothetical protein
MRPGLTRALVALAAGCLGERRRDWAEAMAAELDAARADGRALSFAAGCVVAALRQMPGQAEGRLHLASHALALGVLVPAAFLQFACAIGLSCGQGGLYGALGVAGAQNPMQSGAQLAAMPALLFSWLLLGIGHLQLAWTLLERDWTRVARAGALIAGASLTLFLLMGLLLLDAVAIRLLAGVLAIELPFVLGLAQWHARVFPTLSPA